ncbi:MAG: ATP--guanido phosphotransferase [Kiritimatiellia bacterium]
MKKTSKTRTRRIARPLPYEALVCSSRIRLARNLRGVPFPGWADTQARVQVWERVSGLLHGSACMSQPLVRAMGELDALERMILQERRLISLELAAGDATSGVIYESAGRLSIMINEEDHLRFQSVAPGFALQEAWNALQVVYDDVAAMLPFAFLPRYGYLTACPSNVGTGIRASVMVHLAGLRLLGELDAVVRGLQRTGFAVRGISGEGSSAKGGFCQISNQKTLGLSEADTLREVCTMVESVLQAEYGARDRLQHMRPLLLEDAVARAYGVLRHARLLSTGEALDYLSAVMLGVERGMLGGVDMGMIRDLLRDVQPGHLQFQSGRTLAPEERDQYRATYLRQALASMELI